ncbi:preprotein translocase subunit YajC [Streptomyces sp. NPDC002812]|uniref:preprotein translocase subunit YajC n=1 Tax=unclassified Streptomyces TaxID=2593676 RepID=UPI00202E7731|nr:MULTISPECIES: preprotein translocase subunit YajC [unclassified Streptomyces]MCM1971170.1 preprotein translocase subunit YajC [Streptomyces sp. G1]MCX5299548.1 preprotein translocase subunit YajC [Streptomyces sp. NBC_00193]
MNIMSLLPFVLIIGAMFLLTRSQKKKQQQAVQMRDQLTAGTGVRTIGGMYATVKEIGEDTVTLEVAPGVHAIYAKNAIGAVLEDEEYNRIVHGITDDLTIDTPVVPDDASSLTGDEAPKLDLGKKDEPQADEPAAEDSKGDEPKDGKSDGEAGAK